MPLLTTAGARAARCLVPARVWGLVPLLAGAATAAAAWVALPPDPIAVPARDGVTSILWPLFPALPAMLVPAAAAPARRDLERSAGRSGAALRARFTLMAVVLLAAACTAATGTGLLVAGRNTAFLLGAALLAAATAPASAAWIPPVAIPLACWLLGTGLGGRVAGWAWLLHPAGEPCAAAGSATVLATGILAFVTHNPGPRRPWPTRPRPRGYPRQRPDTATSPPWSCRPSCWSGSARARSRSP